MAKRQYKTINKKDHPRADYVGHVLEHIVVAEEKLGRQLSPGKTVHHIDGNKKNNSPDNLMVFATGGDHIAFHSGCNAYKKEDIWYAVRKVCVCQTCNKEFLTNNSKEKRGNKYCSAACRHMGQRKIQSLDTIIDMLRKYNGNFTQAAKELNVTGNALVKRLKRAGLPYHSKDYKNNKTAG